MGRARTWRRLQPQAAGRGVPARRGRRPERRGAARRAELLRRAPDDRDRTHGRRAAACIDLDGLFGLHPALAPLEPHWRDGTLAFVHACGSPDPTRSHFDAQDYMESGTPGVKRTGDGWMNRVLARDAGQRTRRPRRLSLGADGAADSDRAGCRSRISRWARGAARPTADGPSDRRRPRSTACTAATIRSATPIRKGARRARKLMSRTRAGHDARPTTERPSPQGILRRHRPPRASDRRATRASGSRSSRSADGTRTSTRAASKGQLANHLKPLGEGLASFANALGPHYQDTVILVISEFGRTVHENGNGGTDHGHGNVMWVMGGPVRGRKVYGAWPGLSTATALPGTRPRGDHGLPRADRGRAARAHGARRHADREGLSRPPAGHRPHREFDQGVVTKSPLGFIAKRWRWPGDRTPVPGS